MQPVTPRDVDSWVTAVQRLLREGACDGPNFLRPYHFLVLAVAMHKQQHTAGTLTLPRGVSKYASRMHLWEAIGQVAPHTVNERDPSGNFSPVEVLRSREEAFDSARKVAAVAGHSDFGSRAHDSLEVALSEVIENCFAHAEIGESVALTCAQYWPKGKRLQIAVCDGGRGIRSNLEQADTEDVRRRTRGENACELATELGVSSKLTGDHAGYGLALLRQLVEQNGGTVSIHSGGEWFHSCNRVPSRGRLLTPWQGTLVVAEFNTRAALNSKEVYDSWSHYPVRGYTHDDFDTLFD